MTQPEHTTRHDVTNDAQIGSQFDIEITQMNMPVNITSLHDGYKKEVKRRNNAT